MTDDRADLTLEIRKGIRADVSLVRRDLASESIRLSAMEDHQRGTMTSIYGMQPDIADLKMRVDRIERRLGLTDTEH